MNVGAPPEGSPLSGHWTRSLFGYVGAVMKWRFDCFVCGLRWEEEHKDIDASEFVFSKKKEGRPMVDCPACSTDDVHTPLRGDLGGNRG